MTLAEFIPTLLPYIDKNGLIKPAKADTDSGNGVLFSAILVVLIHDIDPMSPVWMLYTSAMQRCFKEPGLLMRTPTNDYGQESYDDYLGVAVTCLVTRQTRTARQILWYGIKHFGFYNNTDAFTWSAWLWRFPQVWLLMWVAGFPWLKFPLMPLILLTGWLMAKNTNATDASGSQLIWTFLKGVEAMGVEVEFESPITITFASYYESSHPFIAMANQLYGSKS